MRTVATLLHAAAAVLFAVVATTGCGSSHETSPPGDAALLSDAGNTAVAADAGAVDGATRAGDAEVDAGSFVVPPLVTPNGGPVLAHPRLVTLTFSDDGAPDRKEAFGDWVVGSSWLAAASEYGVSTGTHVKKARLALASPATASETDIKTILADAVTHGDVPAPDTAADPLLYVVYFPKTTVLTLPGKVHCASFSGYHSEGRIGGVAYAVAAVGDCPAYVKGLNEDENVLRTASHEIIEAATDPMWLTAPGFAARSTNNPWFLLAGEVGDVCPLSGIVRDAGFVAQRYWSNAAAAAGTNPCVPAPAGEYFITSVSPETTVSVAPGASTTLTLRGHSTLAGAAPWRLQVITILPGAFDVTTHLSTTTIADGQTGTLTVDVPAGAPSGKSVLVGLYSYRSKDVFTYWPIAVRTP